MKKLEDYNSDELDDLVYDIAQQMASNANNNGIHGQLEFLKVVAGMDEESILEALNEDH